MLAELVPLYQISPRPPVPIIKNGGNSRACDKWVTVISSFHWTNSIAKAKWVRKQAKEKTRYWTKLSDTLLQCLKGLSTQKDGTRIRTTIDLWYDHGQDPAMLTFNQGAMREHVRLYLQAKSSRRLKIVFTAELKILHPSSLHNVFTMPSKNFTPYICIISHSRVHIPHHDQQVTTCHPPNHPGASRRNSSLHTTIFGGRIYLHLYQFYLYTLFHLYFFQILVLLYFYCSPTLQLFHYWISATEVSSCVWVWGGTKMIRGPKLIAWQFSDRSPSKHEKDQREGCDQLCLTIAHIYTATSLHAVELHDIYSMCFLLYFQPHVWEHCKIKNPFPIPCPDLVMNLYSINVDQACSTNQVDQWAWIEWHNEVEQTPILP